MTELITRIKTRLSYADDERLMVEELLQTICDRVKLRAGEFSDFPAALNSIAVDATVKAYRRIEYEGISTEGAVDMNTSFVDDILAEYATEIAAYKDSKGGTQNGAVRFI